MANANIFQQYLTPVRSPLDYANDLDRRDLMQLQLQGQQRQNALADLAFGEQQSAIKQREAEGNALRNIAAQAKTPEDMIAGLRASGLPGLMQRADQIEAQALTRKKTDAEVGKIGAEADEKRYKVSQEKLNAARQFVLSLPDKNSLIASLNTAHDIPFQERSMLANSAPDDPAQFQIWKQQRLLPALTAEQQLTAGQPKFTDTGGALVNTNPLATAAPVAKTMTPGEAGRLSVEQQRLAMDRSNAEQAVKYETDGNGNIVALPAKAAPGAAISARPVGGPGGTPLQGKPSAAVEKEKLSINQQRATIQGALDAVKQTPGAFSFGRGVPTLMGAIPESLAGRADSPAESQARSYVYNNVSKVINERAGAAQSAQEMARLRSFLPAETDNAEQIVNKLTAFNAYLDDVERGTTTAKPATAPAKPAASGFRILKVQ